MRVPDYSNFQTTPGSTGTQPLQLSSAPTPGQIGAEQMSSAGQGLQRAGDFAARIALSMQEQANQVRVSDAMNQAIGARLKLTHDPQSGYTQLMGRSALDRPDGKALPDEYGEALDKQLASIRDGLGNDAQKQAFQLQADQLATQFRGEVSKHMVAQDGVYRLSTHAGTAKVATDMMGLEWSNPQSVEQGRNAIKAAITEIGRIQGLSPVETAAKMVEALTPAHTSVVASAIQAGRVDYAAQYLQSVREELTPAARLKLDEMVKTGASATLAQVEGARLAGSFGYTQTSEALKAIDALPYSAEEKKAIRVEVEHRHAVQQADADKANAQLMGRLHYMVEAGASPAQIMKSAEFTAVRDPGQVLQLIRERQEHQVQMQNAAESRDWSRVQRLRAEQEYVGTVRMYPYTDPTVLMGMSRDQVAGMVLQLGPKNTEELLQRFDRLKGDEAKLREAKMDHTMFQSIAAEVFGASKVFKPSDDMKETLARAKTRVDGALTEWRVQNPKASPDEIRDKAGSIMRGMLADEVVTRGWIWNGSTNVLAVPDKDAAKVVVPAQDAQQITEALRRARGDAKYQPTPEELGRLYLTKRQRDAVNR